LANALDFGAADGPATVILLIATPASSFSDHLEVLATLARSLSKESFRESLRRAYDTEVIAELINSKLGLLRPLERAGPFVRRAGPFAPLGTRFVVLQPDEVTVKGC
jgi:hypothetical protein